jgi:hypothetical protein
MYKEPNTKWDIVFTLKITGSEQTKEGWEYYKKYVGEGYYACVVDAPWRETLSQDSEVEKLIIEQVDAYAGDLAEYKTADKDLKPEESLRVRLHTGTAREAVSDDSSEE